jgi:hypothetical protein
VIVPSGFKLNRTFPPAAIATTFDSTPAPGVPITTPSERKPATKYPPDAMLVMLLYPVEKYKPPPNTVTSPLEDNAAV